MNIPERRISKSFFNHKNRNRMTHALKTTLEYFNKIQQQKKNFELRKIDRPFKVNDRLLLQEHDGEKYTGNELELIITDVFSGTEAEKFGLKKGFGIISFNEIRSALVDIPRLNTDILNKPNGDVTMMPPPVFPTNF